MLAPLFSGSGMRVKIIEGMAHGKAIVTTPVGCEGIDAENRKAIFIANNHREFAKFVISLLNDNEKIVRTGQNAAQFVYQHYNNTTLIAQLADFYNKHLQ
jgi:glycosyltransferase involved in cell wall biosynthesis